MSVYGMKPKFTDWSGYAKWAVEWGVLYKTLSGTCRTRKAAVKAEQTKQYEIYLSHQVDKESPAPDYARLVALLNKYHYDRIIAAKMMTLRNEAKIRWANIKVMQKGIKDQYATFPMKIEDARNIDFHFNKKHLEFPQIPMWSLKAKGNTFYIQHLVCEKSWSTHEKPDDTSTKGTIRIKRGNIFIDESGTATIR